MSKKVKSLIEKEYTEQYAGVDTALVVDVTGLGGNDTVVVRRKLSEHQLELRVVKNSLLRRAVADAPLAPLASSLEGPSALVIGGESAGDAAKVLVRLAKEYDALTLKTGIVEGEPDLMSVEEIAKLPTRLEVLAKLAGAIRGPGARIAGAAGGPAALLAGCLKAIADKEDEAGEAAAAEAG